MNELDLRIRNRLIYLENRIKDLVSAASELTEEEADAYYSLQEKIALAKDEYDALLEMEGN